MVQGLRGMALAWHGRDLATVDRSGRVVITTDGRARVVATTRPRGCDEPGEADHGAPAIGYSGTRLVVTYVCRGQSQVVVFGPDGEKCVHVEFDGSLRIGDTAEVPQELVYVHDAHREEPSAAFALAHLSKGPTQPTCIGVFRDVQRPVYGELLERQIETATE